MQSEPTEVAIPPEILPKWQRIVDLLANIMHVPSAVVCKLEPPHCTHYKIVAANSAEENPFPLGDIFAMDIGTFCETVIKSREPLLVADAREDERWAEAPELKVGMVSYLGLPVVWPDGRMFGTICVLDDKTNRYSGLYQELLSHCRDVLEADLHTQVRLSGELEDQRAHLSELFTRIPEAIVMIDGAFQITRVNPEFTKIFGYGSEEALGREIKGLITPDDLHDEADSLLQRMFQTSEAFAVDTVRRKKDGARVAVSLICVPVQSHGGQKAGYVIYRDMSDAKRLEDEQRRYHEIELELAHANRIATLGQLSASIAHELNQPLTGIVANCSTCLQMLTIDPHDLAGAGDAVRRTMRDATRASQVVSRLRALFANKEPRLELVDLNEAAAEVVALSSSDIQSSSVIVRTAFAGDLPPVSADRVQLQQVVLNLLRNALDAMSSVDDRPRNLLIKTESEPGGFVRLSVKDAGIGFAPDVRTKMFEPFYSTKQSGMGIGLAVSRSIIESHNGKMWAEFNDGPGATFSFSIPTQILSPLSAQI